MPLAKLKPVEFDTPAPVPARPFPTDLDGIVTLASPARLLQQRLEARTLAGAGSRWPTAQAAALIVASSLALWAAILESAAQVVHAVA